MKSKAILFFCCTFLLFPLFSGAEESDIDSIRGLIRDAKTDTAKMRLLVRLSAEFEVLDVSPYEDTVIRLADKLLSDKKINTSLVLRQKADALCNIAFSYKQQGNILKALDLFKRSLVIREEIADSIGIGVSYNSLGITCDDQGNVPEALDYLHQSLALRQRIKDQKGESETLDNLGHIYQEQGDQEKALDYYLKSLEIGKKINWQEGIGDFLNDIAAIYQEEADALKATQLSSNSAKADSLLIKALDYNNQALKIQEEIDDQLGLVFSYNNIGRIYSGKGDYSLAAGYYSKSLKICKDVSDKEGTAEAFYNLSTALFGEEKYKEALDYSDSSLLVSRELGYPEDIRNAEELLAKILYRDGKYKEAFDHYQEFVKFRDSIATEETNMEAVKEQFRDEYNKKEEQARDEREKQELKGAEQDKRLMLIVYASVGGLLIVIVFSIFLINRIRITRQQKEIIEQRNQEVVQQKNEIEEKQKEIVDSIHYAKRIQHALLASDQLLAGHLPEYFVMLKPKAIVSGDFYWAQSSGSKFLIAACDCTGHGVPGAFMSLLNISFLNESVIGKNIHRPDLILNQQRENIIQSLNPGGNEEEGKDGMDCALCSFDFKNMHLEFACSNNPVWIVTKEGTANPSLKEFPPDKMPIGMHHGETTPFTLHSTLLKKGDTVYMFTDGYADQFGGEKGKKFKYKQLQELLLSIYGKPMADQKKILDETIEKWRGDLEQLDDILIIGVRV